MSSQTEAGDRALRLLLGSSRTLVGLRQARDLADELLGEPAGRWTDALTDVVDGSADQLAAIGAVHAMTGLEGREADDRLSSLLDDDRAFVVEHASWALSARRPHRPSMIPLAGIVGTSAGFAGMLAQRTLEGWAATDAAAVAAATCRLLEVVSDHDGRARLVETLGLTSRRVPWRLLGRIAADADECLPARLAAVAALGDRQGDDAVLLALTKRIDELAEHAVLALHDRRLIGRRRRPTTGAVGIGQVFVHSDFGADDRVGAGDQGGITTLLRLLAGELSTLDGVGDAVSIGSGGVLDALLTGMPRSAPGPSVAAVPFGPPGAVDLRAAWRYRVTIERGLRRVVRSLPGLDLLHLRMADVGTVAAARVARQEGLPIVFTAAPDPHGVIEAMDDEGALERDRFGDSDVTEHWWFRVRMVERLVAQAARVVLLPRTGGPAGLARLLGSDDLEARSTVVPEGVHAASIRRARTRVAEHPVTDLGPTVDDLLAALAQLPSCRRRLPLVVSVGRLHPAKGMAHIVAAWRAALARSTNLVIIGGDLESPSVSERSELDAIGRIATPRDGLVLLGRRSHEDVATVLHLAAGLSSSPFPCGVYVAGSRKEEFGLAIVEAMACGLPVVAPAAGGPSTYIHDGVDGILVHDATTSALADAMRRALELSDLPGRSAATAARLDGELTIERMAVRLRDIYVAVAAGTGVRS